MPKSRDVDGVQQDYDSFDDDDDHEDEEIDEALLLDPEEELLVDHYHRAIIMPYSAREFQPQNPASKAVNYALKSKFQHPFENWTAVKGNQDAWNQFWNGFREKVTWHRRHRAAIKSIFNKKAAKRLSGLFSDARKKLDKDPNNPPKWLAGGSSSTLVSKWASPEYQAKCQRNKQTRDTEQAKSSCVHLGGSRSAATLRIQFIKKYERAPTFMEMNALMHKYADSDDWAGPRAEEVVVSICVRGRRFAAGSMSSFFQSDPYGIRDIADDSSHGSHRSTGRSRPSQETDEQYEERLRAAIREEVRQENQQDLEQQVQQLVQQQLRQYEASMAATRAEMFQGPYAPQPQYNNPPTFQVVQKEISMVIHGRKVTAVAEEYLATPTKTSTKTLWRIKFHSRTKVSNSPFQQSYPQGGQTGARRQRVMHPTLTINEGGQDTSRRRAPAPQGNDKRKGKQQVQPEEDDQLSDE
ncbi:hypothetical protein TSUD_216410 [Trifolium subterraneum]|uniref:Uncharacterized protein n=1 Tax=Trifolium subterraneum TaxID=3900 RepID=A0A2Z6MKD3_TRISU|nr:hypothetical protein TSUD_216410 [Trifolium subterraneum]